METMREALLESPRKSYTFRFCWVNTDANWTETVFHDGTRVTAMPRHGDAAYANLARELGYAGPEAEAQLSREHEMLHTFLAERLDGRASPTLWAVAHGQTGIVAPVWQQEEEEGLVLAFQRFLNGGDGGDEVGRLAERGVDVEALRRGALHVLRG